MRFLHTKLHTKRGVSMVIALVFLLLCTMVGTVVITAASAGIGAVSNERADSQRTLALISAAEYASAQLQEAKFTGSYIEQLREITVSEIKTDDNGEKYDEVKSITSSFTKTNGTGAMKPGSLFASVDITPVYLYNNPNVTISDESMKKSVTYELTFTAAFAAGADYSIPTVTGLLTIDENYNAKLILACGSDSMTLTFPATSELKPRRADNLAGTTTPNLSSQEVVSGTTKTSTKTTETTYTTTVTWGEPTIIRGGMVS